MFCSESVLRSRDYLVLLQHHGSFVKKRKKPSCGGMKVRSQSLSPLFLATAAELTSMCLPLHSLMVDGTSNPNPSVPFVGMFDYYGPSCCHVPGPLLGPVPTRTLPPPPL